MAIFYLDKIIEYFFHHWLRVNLWKLFLFLQFQNVWHILPDVKIKNWNEQVFHKHYQLCELILMMVQFNLDVLQIHDNEPVGKTFLINIITYTCLIVHCLPWKRFWLACRSDLCSSVDSLLLIINRESTVMLWFFWIY